MTTDNSMSRRCLIQRSMGLAATFAIAAPVWGGAAETLDLAISNDRAASPISTPDATPHGETAVTISMSNGLLFEPAVLTIPRGTTVTWVNNSPVPHTATGDPGQSPVGKSHPEYIELPEGAEPWGSELMQPGESYSHTFDVPGEYRYICVPHVLSGMRGTIMVGG